MTTAGGGVRLTPFERRHLAATFKWFNDPELARLMDRRGQITPEEHERWFAGLAQRRDTMYWAIEDDDRHVGNVWLADIDAQQRKAEVRVLVGERAAAGCGSRAIDLASRQAFDSLGLHRVYAYVLAFNQRARRAFENAGFVLEGTLRHDRNTPAGFVDSYLLARLNERP
jgi:RimJ/RimL family protein N-acetyltransferase